METSRQWLGGHVYGKNIIGAESFTAVTEVAKWMNHPASIKSLATRLLRGHQPLRVPSLCDAAVAQSRAGHDDGPWGIHYERTETWWEQTAVHEYLADATICSAGTVLATFATSNRRRPERSGAFQAHGVCV